jgi:hypothetical protein
VERLRATRERVMVSCDCVERETEQQRKGTTEKGNIERKRTIERKQTTLFTLALSSVLTLELKVEGE